MKSVKSSGSATTTPPSYKFTVTVEDKGIPMEIDTGSSVTLLSSIDFSKLGGQIDYTQTFYSDPEKLHQRHY